MHTIWLREHNRIATKLLELNPDWDGERIYHEARKIVGAMLQHITYKEWLPLVLGQDGFNFLIGPYKQYNPKMNPSVSNAFASAAFRFGHTLINPQLERLDKALEPLPQGPLPLHEAFFAPERLLAEGGVDPYENDGVFTPLQLAQIRKTTLAKVLCTNGDAIDRIQPNVFRYMGKQNMLAYRACDELPALNLRMWMSCCDESCSARAGTGSADNEQEKGKRRKRAVHLYANGNFL
uniref:Peroxidasin n=1 Tax=Globodera pallida TaxID=36090 RepID=A0A183C0G6_GLOPA